MNMIRFQITLLVAAVVGIAAIIGLSGSRVDADPKQIVTAWSTFWNSRDASSAPTLFTDDVVYEDVTFGVVNNGITELETFAQGYFDVAPPDARFDVVASDIKGG